LLVANARLLNVGGVVANGNETRRQDIITAWFDDDTNSAVVATTVEVDEVIVEARYPRANRQNRRHVLTNACTSATRMTPR
jgi:hypothetical protein